MALPAAVSLAQEMKPRQVYRQGLTRCLKKACLGFAEAVRIHPRHPQADHRKEDQGDAGERQ